MLSPPLCNEEHRSGVNARTGVMKCINIMSLQRPGRLKLQFHRTHLQSVYTLRQEPKAAVFPKDDDKVYAILYPFLAT